MRARRNSARTTPTSEVQLNSIRISNKVQNPGVTTLEIDDNKATTMAQASARANAELNNALAVDTVKAEFKSLPVWHLEPGDRVSIQTARLGTEFLMQKYSLPLTHSGVMTVGANRAVSRRPLLNGRR